MPDGIPLRIAEPTGRYRRSLRRFRFTTRGPLCPERQWGCDASTEIGIVTDPADAHGDNWPHDDPRWPTTCTACGGPFTDADEWQRNDNGIYRLPDGTEFAFHGSFGRAAPPGAMIRATWYDAYAEIPGESWLVSLPDGGEWITTQRASGGGHWDVTGTAPNLTVSPSIWHNSPKGWHGWIRDGHLVGT